MSRTEIEDRVRKEVSRYVRNAKYWQTLRVWCDNAGEIIGVDYDSNATPNTAWNGHQEAINVEIDPWDIPGTVEKVLKASQDAKNMAVYIDEQVTKTENERGNL